MNASRGFGLIGALVFAGVASAQHLGEVVCKADAAVVGTIVAMKPLPASAGRSAVAMTVQVEQRLKGAGGAPTLDLTFEAERIPDSLRPGAKRVFLLQAGKPIRIEPEEHLAITRKLLADKSLCAPR